MVGRSVANVFDVYITCIKRSFHPLPVSVFGNALEIKISNALIITWRAKDLSGTCIVGFYRNKMYEKPKVLLKYDCEPRYNVPKALLLSEIFEAIYKDPEYVQFTPLLLRCLSDSVVIEESVRESKGE